jgi:hypothetical protein
VLPAGETLLESRDIQGQLFGILRELGRSEAILVIKQEVMHGPERLLITGACGRLCGFEGMRVHLKGQIEIDELDLPRIDEFLEDQR